MFRYPSDLDWSSAVVEIDPDAWDTEYVDCGLEVHAYLSLGYSWPPMPRETLDLVPNVDFLEVRDRELAEYHPGTAVTGLAEALRHFRILDKYHDPVTLLGGEVFFGPRTQSALDIYYAACEEGLPGDAKAAFLFPLIYTSREVREYILEGNTYKLGNWQLSLPWAVVESGIVPPALKAFGRQLENDGLGISEHSRTVPGTRELFIHDCPTSNPWLLPQTREFLTGITGEWGWYTALDSKRTDPYIFYATCVDHQRVHPDGYRMHPLRLTLDELDRLARLLERLEEQGERPDELTELFDKALVEEEEFPFSLD